MDYHEVNNQWNVRAWEDICDVPLTVICAELRGRCNVYGNQRTDRAAASHHLTAF